ncbi:MAG: hypothetical protein IPM95_12735 [Sphingobacteriales bacterium]|nr:hypothetical protein [Sphingobacteriales bacterium]
MNKAVRNSIIIWTVALILVHGIFVHEHISKPTRTQKISFAFNAPYRNLLYTILAVNPGSEHFNNVFVKQEKILNEQDPFFLFFVLSLLIPVTATSIFSIKRYTETHRLTSCNLVVAYYKRGPPR